MARACSDSSITFPGLGLWGLWGLEEFGEEVRGCDSLGLCGAWQAAVGISVSPHQTALTLPC